MSSWTRGNIFEKTIFGNPVPRLDSIKKGVGKNTNAFSLGSTESFPAVTTPRDRRKVVGGCVKNALKCRWRVAETPRSVEGGASEIPQEEVRPRICHLLPSRPNTLEAGGRTVVAIAVCSETKRKKTGI